MKKWICILLSVVLLCIGAGCAPGMEKVEWDAAVDERVVDSIGKPANEVKSLFGLQEDEKSEEWPSMYIDELVWCGMPLNTEFGFFEDVCDTVLAKAIMTDTEDTEKIMRDALKMLEEQFGAPYRYTVYDFTEGGSLSMYEIPEEDAMFETLRSTENGGIGLRYSIGWEYNGMSPDGSHLEVNFFKYEDDPNNVKIMFSLQYFEP